VFAGDRKGSGGVAAAYSFHLKLSTLMTYFLRTCGLVMKEDHKATLRRKEI
jgi:hypothetical protein